MDPNSLIPANNPSFFVENKDLLLVLVGDFLAALPVRHAQPVGIILESR